MEFGNGKMFVPDMTKVTGNDDFGIFEHKHYEPNPDLKTVAYPIKFAYQPSYYPLVLWKDKLYFNDIPAYDTFSRNMLYKDVIENNRMGREELAFLPGIIIDNTVLWPPYP